MKDVGCKIQDEMSWVGRLMWELACVIEYTYDNDIWFSLK